MLLLILVVTCLTLGLIALYFSQQAATQQQLTRSFHQPADRSAAGRNGGLVLAYHPQARQIGEAVLEAGGNAFDAFVATVAAENVLAEGASSLAGPLGVLLYRAQDNQVTYLDADFNDPLDPDGLWTSDDPRLGKTAVVPGAPAGLEALATAYGRTDFAQLLQPAIELAEHGFPINKLMAGFIARHAKALKKTRYGRQTFFARGEPLTAGDVLRQPELAHFLRGLAGEGAAHVYHGSWGESFLSLVAENGGRLTESDLAEYAVKWREPWTTTYRDCLLFSSSGRSYGGLWALLALKTLEHTTLSAERHYSRDVDDLEQLIRIARQVWSEPDLLDYRALDDPETVYAMLTAEHTGRIWGKVQDKVAPHIMESVGSHSYHVIVTDREGNIANGTTTIESEPWAEGLFVEGVVLPSSGIIPWHTEPGARRLSPFSIHLALRDSRPCFAVGSISNSVVETSFQFLVNLIDYGMSARDAISTPRFGTFPYRGTAKKPVLRLDTNWLDPRVPSSTVKTLKARGIKVEQRGVVDTGLGAVARILPESTFDGAIAPVPYVSNPFGHRTPGG